MTETRNRGSPRLRFSKEELENPELARKVGVHRSSVSNAISRRKRGCQSRKSQKMTKYWYVTVEGEDEDE